MRSRNGGFRPAVGRFGNTRSVRRVLPAMPGSATPTSTSRCRVPLVTVNRRRARVPRLAALCAATTAAAGAAAWTGGGVGGAAAEEIPRASLASASRLEGAATTPDLVAPTAPVAGTRVDARFGLPGTAWSARVESVAAFAREGVLREVPGGVRVDALAALGDEVAIVGGARAQAAFGGATPDLRPDLLGEAEVLPLVGARAALSVDRASGLAIELDATPLDGGIGARAVYRTALDRAWRLELGIGVTHGLDAPWSGELAGGSDPVPRTRGAAWIGLRASF